MEKVHAPQTLHAQITSRWQCVWFLFLQRLYNVAIASGDQRQWEQFSWVNAVLLCREMATIKCSSSFYGISFRCVSWAALHQLKRYGKDKNKLFIYIFSHFYGLIFFDLLSTCFWPWNWNRLHFANVIVAWSVRPNIFFPREFYVDSETSKNLNFKWIRPNYYYRCHCPRSATIS